MWPRNQYVGPGGGRYVGPGGGLYVGPGGGAHVGPSGGMYVGPGGSMSAGQKLCCSTSLTQQTADIRPPILTQRYGRSQS